MKSITNAQKLICNAIIRGKIPDSALQSPVIEVIRNTRIVGGGESASWATWTTIRENGKQLLREQIRPEDIPARMQGLYPGADIREAGKQGKSTVFVII